MKINILGMAEQRVIILNFLPKFVSKLAREKTVGWLCITCWNLAIPNAIASNVFRQLSGGIVDGVYW